MARYELTDEQYALIAPELPTNDGKTGHPYAPHRPIINGIFWRLHAGAAWPDIPERYGKWKTIYDRYTAWRRNGIWERLLKALQAKLDAQAISIGSNGRWTVQSCALTVWLRARRNRDQMARRNHTTMRSDDQWVASAPKCIS
jgi:putative transposase